MVYSCLQLLHQVKRVHADRKQNKRKRGGDPIDSWHPTPSTKRKEAQIKT
jgi:hypothetical protein